MTTQPPTNPAAKPPAAVRFQAQARPGSAKPTSSKASPPVALIVASVVAALGIAGVVVLFIERGGLLAEQALHRSAALDAAKAANVAVDTNTPLDWNELWPRITAALNAMRNELDRQAGRIRALEQELEGLPAALTEAQNARAQAQKAAQELGQLQQQVQDLQRALAEATNRVAALLSEINRLQTDPEAARAAARVVAGDDKVEEVVEGADAPSAVEGTEPQAIDTEAEEFAQRKMAGVTSDVILHTFPPRRSDLLEAVSYRPATQVMEVMFKNGVSIRYEKFPQSLFEKFIASPTFETFYRMKILGRYPSVPDDEQAVRSVRYR